VERSRITRYLRIAVTALSLTACVLLIALWVRSYKWHDGVWGRFSEARGFHLSSHEGRVQLSMLTYLGIVEWRIVYGEPIDRVGPANYFAAFECPLSTFGLYMAVPYWFLLAVMATFAAGIATKRRFSLRTLLIATTLIAILLGAVVYSTT
jgi:hypothetical protein